MKRKMRLSMMNLAILGFTTVLPMGLVHAADITAGNQESSAIALPDLYVRPDYLEIESLKDTKEIIAINKKDIEGKGYANVSDVLKDVPSISVNNAGRGVIDIRGQGADVAQNNIQVLIDGAPATTLTNHPYIPDYNLVPVEAIEKIEIIPGGGSVLYGAGATGGVINITTNLKNLKASKQKITTEYSNLGHNLAGDFNFKIDDKTVSNVGYSRSKEKFFFKNTYINKDYIHAGIARELANNGKISFRYSHMKDDGQYLYNVSAANIDAYGKDYVPPKRKKTIGVDDKGKKIVVEVDGYNLADRERDSYNLSYQKDLGHRWGVTSDIFYSKGYFTNNFDEDKTMDQHTKGMRLKFDHGYGEDNNLLLGIDYLDQDARIEYDDYKLSNKKYIAVPLHFAYKKKSLGIYALNKLRHGKWIFTQGLRREKTNWSFDKEANAGLAGKGERKTWNTAGELSLAYAYNDIGRVYARWERGYSLPDGIQISDQARINGKKTYFPTGAQDEKYDNYELGLRDKIGISTVKLTVFLSTTNNQLRRMYLTSINDASTQNLLNTRRKGIDLTLGQRFGKLKLEESYTYLKGESHYTDAGLAFIKQMNLENKKIDWAKSGLQYVPTHKATLKLDYTFDDKTTAGLRWTYFGSYNNFFKAQDDNSSNVMRSHSLTDLYIRHKANENFDVYGGVTNLFNKRYYEYAGDGMGTYYIGQGRNFYLGMNYKF